MKLSDYVLEFVSQKTDSIFLLSGGGIMHLVDSVRKSNINAYCCHHEQAAATAAEGYARLKNDVGVCLVTTGPGGTNAITGVAGAWLDSIPVLVISGQVKIDNIMEKKDGKPKYRQLGFQELNIIDMIKPITKHAVTIENKNLIKYHLEKAYFLAKFGRPGPVWVEIPLDIQEADIEANNLKGFTPPDSKMQKIPMDTIVKQMKKSKRPLLMAGNGIRLAGGVDILWKVLNKLKIKAVTPIFTADDLITYDYKYYLGRQGIPGNKMANYAVDNCDLLLVIGERLQLTQTSYDYKNFATQATKIMVDIDENELYKKTIQIDVPVFCDAKLFLEELYKQDITLNKWDLTVESIDTSKLQGHNNYLNIYKFFEELNKYIKGYNIATANGMASVATHQAIKISNGQRLITNAGLGQMGSGLPLAIGACIANNKKTIICMEGDGSIMLNIHELQTIVHHKLPIKIFIFNNNGYYSIRNTHENYFKKVFAADSQTGVTLPNFEKLIPGWGIKYEKISNDKELIKIKNILDYKGPIVCELRIDPHQPMLPKWTAGKFFNR